MGPVAPLRNAAVKKVRQKQQKTLVD